MLEELEIMLEGGAKMPTRAHETDAGLDLYSTETIVVPANGGAVFNTGVHLNIPNGYVGFIKSKSGLNVKHGLTAEGVIDAGYTGAIIVKVYNHSNIDYQINAGDKLTQLVILPVALPKIRLVSSFEETERGEKGFGSSGR